MADIVAFIEASLAEDEAVARDVEDGGEWHATRHATLPLIQVDVVTGDEDGNIVEYVAEDVGRSNGVHVAAWSPARVLAEIAAKRKLLALHMTSQVELVDGSRIPFCGDRSADPDFNGDLWAPCLTARLLAAPYANHANFDQAWKIDD